MAAVSSSVKWESNLTYLRDERTPAVENMEPPSLSPRKCLVNVHYYHQHYLRAGKSQQTIFLHYSHEPAEAQRDTSAR